MSPQTIFLQFITNEILYEIVKFTNDYVEQNIQPKSLRWGMFKKMEEIFGEEFKIFLGILFFIRL